jgi:hypothetical protein
VLLCPKCPVTSSFSGHGNFVDLDTLALFQLLKSENAVDLSRIEVNEVCTVSAGATD